MNTCQTCRNSANCSGHFVVIRAPCLLYLRGYVDHGPKASEQTLVWSSMIFGGRYCGRWGWVNIFPTKLKYTTYQASTSTGYADFYESTSNVVFRKILWLVNHAPSEAQRTCYLDIHLKLIVWPSTPCRFIEKESPQTLQFTLQLILLGMSKLPLSLSWDINSCFAMISSSSNYLTSLNCSYNSVAIYENPFSRAF